jgi:hypothetical protein
MADPTPNFLYIGTSKAGSTWLFNALAVHPDVYLASNKGLYYFDTHFDKGRAWYLGYFSAAGEQPAVGEISHSYLSSAQAPARIAELNAGMRLLVCLREPVDRAFSDYLDLVKNGQFAGTFEEALDGYPRLVQRGLYSRHLRTYLKHFPPEQLHVQLFDDLKADAQGYADDVFDYLGVDRLQLPSSALKSRMPAARPRSSALAASAKVASRAVKRLGLRRLRSRVKRSVAVRQVLYRPYAGNRPTVDPQTAARLHEVFAPEVLALDELLASPVSERWGYQADAAGHAPGRGVR